VDRLLHVDDLIEPGAEQVLLSRLAWLGHSPSPRFAAAEPSESRSAAQGNRKTELQENSVQIPLILQFKRRYPPQSKGQINGLRIVHGRRAGGHASGWRSISVYIVFQRAAQAPCCCAARSLSNAS
ncbi:hypothetical protein, partial [Mesorhizobium sp. M7A.F.Ca.CA.002.15.1.1]|uniref:hypothetical protein n=1 Tax=Mesorhizobium sp. M7A.F.Ca.CA.002.15.1.1 TaxID=2496717 RepID=UPI0019D090D9